MSTYGWIFLGVSWTAVCGLAAFCFINIFRRPR